MTYSQGMRLRPDNNPGNARWCTDCLPDGRMECAKSRRRNRGACHAPAIRGTDACRTHGGVTMSVAQVKGEARITAWSALGVEKGAKTINSGMAVLGMLQMSWLRATAYGEMLRQQVALGGAIAVPEGHDPSAELEASGLIGFRYGAAGKDGTIYAVSEEARALVALEAAERDRVVRFAKTAHDMGISERITNLAERWGDVVITRIMLVLEGIDLTAEQEAKVPALIQAHLGQIEISSTGAERS